MSETWTRMDIWTLQESICKGCRRPWAHLRAENRVLRAKSPGDKDWSETCPSTIERGLRGPHRKAGVSVVTSTNDNDDDGYPDQAGVEEWTLYYLTVGHAIAHTGHTRRGFYGQPVTVYLDGEPLYKEQADRLQAMEGSKP